MKNMRGTESASSRRDRGSSPKEKLGRKGRRQFWLRVAAALMVIVFLASECSTIIPNW